MSPKDFETTYGVKTNFLAYGCVRNKIKDFLSDKEIPLCAELNP